MKFILAFDFQDDNGKSLIPANGVNAIEMQTPDGDITTEDAFSVYLEMVDFISSRLHLSEFTAHLFYQTPGTVSMGLCKNMSHKVVERPFQYWVGRKQIQEPDNNH